MYTKQPSSSQTKPKQYSRQQKGGLKVNKTLIIAEKILKIQPKLPITDILTPNL